MSFVIDLDTDLPQPAAEQAVNSAASSRAAGRASRTVSLASSAARRSPLVAQTNGDTRSRRRASGREDGQEIAEWTSRKQAVAGSRSAAPPRRKGSTGAAGAEEGQDSSVTAPSAQVMRFYKSQNRLIDSFVHILRTRDHRDAAGDDAELRPETATADDNAEATDNPAEDAISVPETEESDSEEPDSQAGRGACRLFSTAAHAARWSLACNISLLVVKAVALALSSSVAVIGSLLDSALDLFSGVVVWYAHRSMRQGSIHTFPVGKQRYEQIAVLIIACVMSTAAFSLVLTAIQVGGRKWIIKEGCSCFQQFISRC